MTIDYDASALSGWAGARHLFLRYHGTILSGLFRGPMFWVPNLLHIIFCALGGQFATPPVAYIIYPPLHRPTRRWRRRGRGYPSARLSSS